MVLNKTTIARGEAREEGMLRLWICSHSQHLFAFFTIFGIVLYTKPQYYDTMDIKLGWENL